MPQNSSPADHPAPRFQLSVEQAVELAKVAAAVPGVHSLSPGRYGEVALYFPGQKVAGMKFASPKDDTHISVHVVVDYQAGRPLTDIAEDVRAAVLRACSQLARVDVVLADAA